MCTVVHGYVMIMLLSVEYTGVGTHCPQICYSLCVVDKCLLM